MFHDRLDGGEREQILQQMHLGSSEAEDKLPEESKKEMRYSRGSNCLGSN